MKEVRFSGFLGGVALVDDLDAARIADDLVDAGFITRPLRGNTLQISPPFITTDAAKQSFLDAIEQAVTEAAK